MIGYSLERCDDSFIRPTVEEYHYLHRWPHPLSLPFGHRLIVDHQEQHEDGRPFGITVFKKLQHKKQERLFGYATLPTEWQVLDLARVWVHPSLQENRWQGFNRKGELCMMKNNDFSRMVSLGLKRIQRDWIEHHPPRYPELPYHITLIVSYCDREHHQGVGYRAAGFEYFGETSDRTKDVYIRRLKMPRWQYQPIQERLLEVAHA